MSGLRAARSGLETGSCVAFSATRKLEGVRPGSGATIGADHADVDRQLARLLFDADDLDAESVGGKRRAGEEQEAPGTGRLELSIKLLLLFLVGGMSASRILSLRAEFFAARQLARTLLAASVSSF